MASNRFKPALKKRFVETHQDYDVYTVDPFAIRNHAEPDEEFTNAATHEDFPDIIPEGQIWISEATYRTEGRFFLANTVTQLKTTAEGGSQTAAYEAGLQADRELREQLTGMKYRDGRPHKRVPEKIYDREFWTLPDEQGPVKLWLVDPLPVRCFYKTDYAEGGHWQVYPWVPKGEIWLERSIEEAELPYIIAHEYTELRLMRDRGFDYERAHAIAAEMEFDLRRADSRKLFPGLKRRGFTKEDLDALTTAEYFEYVEENYVHSWTRGVRSVVSGLVSKIL